MSLGYVKGKYWVSDDRYASYASRDSYRALLRAITAAEFATEVTYSYNARRYMAEILTFECLGRSGNYYIIKHNNAYDENPMAALIRAIRESGRATPLALACCLEIEAELLLEAVRLHRVTEDRLEKALDALSDLVRSVTLIAPISVDPSDVAAAHWENLQSGATLPVYDEDDDL